MSISFGWYGCGLHNGVHKFDRAMQPIEPSNVHDSKRLGTIEFGGNP